MTYLPAKYDRQGCPFRTAQPVTQNAMLKLQAILHDRSVALEFRTDDPSEAQEMRRQMLAIEDVAEGWPRICSTGRRTRSSPYFLQVNRQRMSWETLRPERYLYSTIRHRQATKKLKAIIGSKLAVYGL
jgi:hypothetical protein